MLKMSFCLKVPFSTASSKILTLLKGWWGGGDHLGVVARVVGGGHILALLLGLGWGKGAHLGVVARVGVG